jgi:hypothetical protein
MGGKPQVMLELLFLEDSFHINELPAKYIPTPRKGNAKKRSLVRSGGRKGAKWLPPLGYSQLGA